MWCCKPRRLLFAACRRLGRLHDVGLGRASGQAQQQRGAYGGALGAGAARAGKLPLRLRVGRQAIDSFTKLLLIFVYRHQLTPNSAKSQERIVRYFVFDGL